MTIATATRDSAVSQLWYRALLTEEQIEGGLLTNISQLFMKSVNAGGAPDGACLFVSIAGTSEVPEGEDDDSPAPAVFFSPTSVSMVPHLITLYKATPSPPPARSRVELLVGKPEDWDLLPRGTH
jgi:hypothetical protein